MCVQMNKGLLSNFPVHYAVGRDRSVTYHHAHSIACRQVIIIYNVRAESL